MPEIIFEGLATWTGGTEFTLSVRGNNVAKVSPPTLLEANYR
jgi:hypothetical protein